MSKVLSVLAVVAVAGTASANIIESRSNPGLVNSLYNGETVEYNSNSNRVAGDTVDAAVTAFGAGGGAFLSGPGNHTVGGAPTALASGAPGLIPEHFIETGVSTSGNTRTLTIFMYASADFLTPLAPAGLAVGGAVLDTIFFEIPDLNGGTDLFDDADKVGIASGTFDLIGEDPILGPAILFSTAAGVTDSGTSFSVGNGVGVDGIDLFDPAVLGATVTGGQWVITYEIVPAPASAALLGLGGLVATRRRR